MFVEVGMFVEADSLEPVAVLDTGTIGGSFHRQSMDQEIRELVYFALVCTHVDTCGRSSIMTYGSMIKVAYWDLLRATILSSLTLRDEL